MRNNILREKSFDFSLSIIDEYKNLINNHKEFVLSKQLLRSGTSIGALIRESEYAQSKPDFISKLSIALKESNETDYWLDLLRYAKYVEESTGTNLVLQNKELLRILISSIKTSKNSLNKR